MSKRPLFSSAKAQSKKTNITARVDAELNAQFLDVTFLKAVPPATKSNQNLLLAKIDALEDWLNRRQFVLGYDPKNVDYKHPNYKWVSREQFMSTHEALKRIYETRYTTSATSWIDAKVPPFGERQDPIFVQRLRVPNDARVVLIGDLHSSMTSLLNILQALLDKKVFINSDTFRLAPKYYLVFLGDIVDRGPYGVELLTLIGQIQIANPQNVFVINGNHEDCDTYASYGYGDELRAQFDDKQILKYGAYLHYLPSAIILQMGGSSYQLCHGALPTPDVPKDRRMIRQLSALQSDSEAHFAWLRMVDKVCSSASIADNLKWGDFNGKIDGVRCNSARADCSKPSADTYTFGRDVVLRYLDEMGFAMILSGHQDASNFTALLPTRRADKRFEVDPNYKDFDLYRPAGYATFPDQQHKITYEPRKDFLAVNTSSCLQSKGNSALKYDCFLELYSPVHCVDMQYLITDIRALAQQMSIALPGDAKTTNRQLCRAINARRDAISKDMRERFIRRQVIDMTGDRPVYTLATPSEAEFANVRTKSTEKTAQQQ